MFSKVFIFYNQCESLDSTNMFNAIVTKEQDSRVICESVSSDTRDNLISKLSKIAPEDSICFLIDSTSMHTSSLTDLYKHIFD